MKADLIYLACPYSHQDPAVRIERFGQANQYAAKLMAAGLFVFSPISHSHPIAEHGLPTGWNYWEQYDRAFLEACGVLVVLTIDGWMESTGVAAEVAIMQAMRKPIYYLTPSPGMCALAIESIKRRLAEKGATQA